ncbi:MAG: hypothetical protein EXS37_14550 [Opitutus sp.]|nr:hypothetical protein [Opitutus sp.]
MATDALFPLGFNFPSAIGLDRLVRLTAIFSRFRRTAVLATSPSRRQPLRRMSSPRESDPDRTLVILQPGTQVFGRYKLEKMVGEGGMGVISNNLKIMIGCERVEYLISFS